MFNDQSSMFNVQCSKLWSMEVVKEKRCVLEKDKDKKVKI